LFVRKLVSARILCFQLEQQKSSVLLPFLWPCSDAVEDGGDLILGHDPPYNMSGGCRRIDVVAPDRVHYRWARLQESKETPNEGILAQGTPEIDSSGAD
jgi:hypothetical protein